ncbi:hypothetical protein ACFL36_00385 [Thermodesulfobacteriota bacterium]
MIRISDHIPLPYVTFGNSNNLTVDEPVATLGYAERIRGMPRPKLTPTLFGGANQGGATEWNYLLQRLSGFLDDRCR